MRYSRVTGANLGKQATPTPEPAGEMLNRREFLIRTGGAAATLTFLGVGLGRILAHEDNQNIGTPHVPHFAASATATAPPNTNEPITPAPGTRPELTPIADHFRLDINARQAGLDAESWRLHVSGLVNHPLELTLTDLRQRYEPLSQYVTLACISNSVGGRLIGTIQWTGARLADVLAEAGLRSGARYAIILSADGFYETLDLALLGTEDRLMICYDWDNNPLPHEHGYPLRLFIPDRYGMKQPKWITGIEITDEYQEGYWVERGWADVAQVRATSAIDVIASDHIFERDNQRLVPIGGIAHAGARGISKVEVQVDGGKWAETQLRAPLSETTWVLWRYDWPFSEGRHTFRVRCAEGDGTPQIEENNPSAPSGATGIDQLSQTF